MKIFRIIKNKYFAKLFIIILFLSLAIISFTFFVGIEIHNQFLRDKMSQNASNNLANSVYVFQTLTSELDQLFTLIRSNRHICAFLQAKHLTYSIDQNLVENLQILYSANLRIASIALYNHSFKSLVYVGDLPNKLDVFLNMYVDEIISRDRYGLSGEEKIFLFSDTSMKSDERRNGMMSFIYPYTSEDGTRSSCVAINIDANQLYRDLFSKNNSDLIMLMSDSGGYIMSNFHKSFPISIRLNLIRHTSNTSAPIGLFPVEFNGNKLTVYYSKIDGTSWVYYYILPTPIGFFQGWPKSFYVVVAIFLIAVFALTISLAISSKLYAPLSSTINILNANLIKQDSLKELFPNQKDEFAYVNAYITNLSKQLLQLETEKTETIEIMKHKFLQNIILRKDDSMIKNSSEIALDFLISFEQLYIFLVKLDIVDKNSSYLFQDSISRSLSSSFGLDWNYEFIILDHHECVVFANDKSIDNDNGFIYNLECFQKIYQLIGCQTISIAVGGIAQNINECAEKYRKAQYLMKQRYVLGLNQIITQQRIEASFSFSIECPTEILLKIDVAIRTGDKQVFMQQYDRLLSALQLCYYQEVVPFLLQTISQLLYAMNEVLLGYQKVNIDFENISSLFESTSTIYDTREWVERLFDDYLVALNKIDNLKENKAKNLSTNVRNYIDLHFSEPGFCLDMVSSHFGFSAAYISKLFKKEFGETIRSYYKKIRIEAIKRSLNYTNYNMEKIAEHTGFSSTNYFYSFVKKEFGLTPSVLRKLLKQSSQNSSDKS